MLKPKSKDPHAGALDIIRASWVMLAVLGAIGYLMLVGVGEKFFEVKKVEPNEKEKIG